MQFTYHIGMFGDQQDFKWFSTLSPEEQHRLAPSYIAILQEQLASAHIRHRKMLSALDIFNQPNGGGTELWDGNRHMTCRNCFAVSHVSNVRRCRGCYENWGCSKCNTDDKLVIKCTSCEYNICEECDPYVKVMRETSWKCSACHYSALILDECNQKLPQLQEGNITRNQAIVIWKPPQGVSAKVANLAYRILIGKLVHSKWIVYCGNADSELETDFPEAEDDNTIVVCPLYEESPHTCKLVTEIANKVFKEEDRDENVKAIWEHDLDSFITARTTYTVREFLESYLDNEHITEETWDSLEPEFLDRVFN